MTAHPYTTQLQAGLGLVHETRTLLDLWQPGMDPTELKETALASGLFPGVTARRQRNVVIECFKPRYMAEDCQPANFLKILKPVLSSSELTQLFFLYTCRANPILADFVRQVYWSRFAAGAEAIEKQETEDFIRRSIDDGKTVNRWSDATITRVRNYLLGACSDYGLLGNPLRNGRRISSFRIEPNVVSYLAHDLHFKEVGDNYLLGHEDWALFGLETEDVLAELKRLALTGQIIVQTAGSVVHIAWRAKSMEEHVRVLAQG